MGGTSCEEVPPTPPSRNLAQRGKKRVFSLRIDGQHERKAREKQPFGLLERERDRDAARPTKTPRAKRVERYIVGRGLAPAVLLTIIFLVGGSKPPPYDVILCFQGRGEEIACNLVTACRLPLGRPLLETNTAESDQMVTLGGNFIIFELHPKHPDFVFSQQHYQVFFLLCNSSKKHTLQAKQL